MGPGVEALGVLPQLRLGTAVDRIADDGVIAVGHVDPDLVGPAGLQPALQQGIAREPLQHPPVGHGMAAIFLGDGHFLPVGGMAANGRVDDAAVLPDAAHHQADVGPGQGVVLELGRQRLVGEVILRYDQQARGVLVDAVDDAGPQLAVDAGEGIAAVVEQGVDQGAGPVSRRRMDHQALGLVDDQQVAILIDDVQGNILGLQGHGLGLRQVQGQHVPGLELVVFPQRAALPQDPALLQQPLGRGAGQIRRQPGQGGVGPFAGAVSRQHHGRYPPWDGRRTVRRSPARWCRRPESCRPR